MFYYEVEFGYRGDPRHALMCIKGRRMPSVPEAEKWLYNYSVSFMMPVRGVRRIHRDYAHMTYDCRNEKRWPVFGKDRVGGGGFPNGTF